MGINGKRIGLKGSWKYIRTLEWNWKRDVTLVPSKMEQLIIESNFFHYFRIRNSAKGKPGSKLFKNSGVVESSIRVIWGCSMFQGLGCLPIKAVRELGSECRETVRSISGVAVRALRGPFLSTRGREGHTSSVAVIVPTINAGASGSTAETTRGSLSLRGSSDRIFENSREGVEEQHQSIPNLVVKLYYGDDTIGEVLGQNSLTAG
ncbi:hypothetical protein GOBAR_DD02046 [Gossypium barbadense]|nr:hypothetical protein GOBAR_DD02046 [Gossypium barbadense]